MADEDSMPQDADAQEQGEAPAATGPPENVDLLTLFIEKVPIADFISMAHGRPLFCTSKVARALFSAYVTLLVRFDVLTPGGSSKQEIEEAMRRSQRIKAKLMQEPVSGPLGVYMRFPLREIPLRRAPIFRALYKIIPVVKWEECTKVKFQCPGQLAESLESSLRKGVISLMGCEPWVLLEDPRVFRNVVRLEVTLTQIVNLPEDVTLPNVSRVKILCPDAAFSDGSLGRIEKALPDLKRLHLVVRPSGLATITSLVDFVATQDFRLSLREDFGGPAPPHGQGREGSFFLSSHLLTLPFSWQGNFFSRLIRLQLDELSDKRPGLSLENWANAILAAPLLRRLGTVSLSFLQLLDPTSEAFQLEEIVVAMEIEDCLRFFNMLLPLHQQQRQCSIKRLGVHFLAPDGVSKPDEEVELAFCAGWYSVATTCLDPKGFVMFSQGQKQVSESAFFQLPYLDSKHFSLDLVDYAGHRVAVSTPLERPLAYNEPLIDIRPRGTFTSGPFRPNAAGDDFEDISALNVQSHSSTVGGPKKTTIRRRGARGEPPAVEEGRAARLLYDLNLQFVDVLDYLTSRKEELYLS